MIKSRRLRWAWHVAGMVEGRSAFKILTGKPTGKRPLGRCRRRWEDNIIMDLKKIGINTRNWVDSPQDRDYWTVLMKPWKRMVIDALELMNIKNISSIKHRPLSLFLPPRNHKNINNIKKIENRIFKYIVYKYKKYFKYVIQKYKKYFKYNIKI